MNYIEQLGEAAKAAKKSIATAKTAKKNEILERIAQNLRKNIEVILKENEKDTAMAKENGITDAMVDRLRLTPERINDIADACIYLTGLNDPVGEVIEGYTRPNGMRITKTRVPMGVIGIIFESRPNVTVDAATLCIKSGNAAILRGGKEAINSNKILMDIMRESVEECGLPRDVIQLVEDTSRESSNQMMKANGYIDVLIPRGGKGLIKAVVENATVPVIETGSGNCHIYIDESADIDMAVSVTNNGKTQRPSVCNALETCLVHRSVADKFLPRLMEEFKKFDVDVRGCDRTREILGESIKEATESDYATEFDDYIMAVKVVDNIDEAIEHISKYSTGHSECIITNDLNNAERFQREIDSACVYVNCSTRFTDGGEFGFGAEIGISTQRLHARGPMGLRELTTMKYLINGDGQIRI
ncbi:glutamate-5-semialdehyde dehydrogenase [Eubacterium sp. MSJ-13]|uniref:glutamate-5-semialdehyde dehydrogenase n=1 Tax=Eubacterium sp. MSJ-13 TaxID=2841513 RepID=UPI001C11A16C|nr:glutamate-5-semialdehyde dehydrogenase [Eubacterium sp. MSJ-13]MBU5479363.1 glutamate-5-semialdehyde dehydrogenase [Eubacterium sp. MSJ-13]